MPGGDKPPHHPGMKIKSTHTAAAIAVTMLSLAACDRATTEEVRADSREAGRELRQESREAGQKLGDAADRTQRALADMGERLSPQVRDATARTKEHLAVAGERTKEALQGDGAITASIKASMLKDPDLSVLKIDVDTTDGVVVLNGLAKDDAARQRATKIAEGTKGVREVKNHLTVKQG
jgi:hyperosmotically inducible periplasmic protein